jgi:hypothetical protein
MDNLLAGYGSDSEESSSSVVNSTVNCKGNQETKAASVSSLLGDVDDSSSSSSENDENKKNELDTDLECHTQTKKKQRCHKENISKEINQEKSNSFLTRNGLPVPRTASVIPIESASMVSWTIDYISHDPRSHIPTHSTDQCQFQKFKELAASQSHNSKNGWASDIRNQNEFRNPHCIHSVIEDFGINDTLGSQAVSRTKTRQRRFH